MMNTAIESVHVLHVDDDSDVAELTAEFLEREDDRLAVDTATSVIDGLDRLADTDYDCIVSDYDMPHQDGIEFVEAVRERHPNLPFILYTGKGTEAIASEAITAGVTDYLQKEGGSSQYNVLANRIKSAVAHFRAEQQAATTQRRLRELSETTDDVHWMVPADWSEFLFVNSAYEDVFGRSRNVLLENPMDFLHSVHPADQDMVTKKMQRASNGEAVDFEFRVNADGEFQRRVWVQAEPIHDETGDPVRIVGFVRDITERTHEEERFRAFIENSTDVISVLDSDGTYQYQSPSSKHVVGYEPDELIGETSFEYIHPEDREDVIETFSEAVTNPDNTVSVEYRFNHKDGTWLWLKSFGNNQLGNPAIEGFVVNSRDITERKQRERQLKRERNKLDEFAGVVSHDLRNPLNVAKGRLDLAIEDYDSEHLGLVARAHERMESIIDDALSLARAGESLGEMEPVELADLIKACWQTVETASAELVVETNTTIQADATRLQQLFENLVRNAVEHGGEEVTITVGNLLDGFYVEDDGPGIPEDERGDIFDPGYSTEADGTGLGLSIVREVAEAHGWEIEMTEGVTGGARIEITDGED